MNKFFPILALGLLVALGACSKKSSGSTDPYANYQQPQYGPPNHNWGNYGSNYVPTGHCGQYQTMPSGCYGTYQGYSYCGNQWYYQQGPQQIYSFPAFGSCGNNGGGYQGDDDWWDDYDTCGHDDDDSSCSSDDDDYESDSDDHESDSDDDSDNDSGDDDDNDNYSSGWKKYWNNMASSEDKYLLFTVPSDGTYHISFKGDYTGKSQDEEQLVVKFAGGNNHEIKDLNQKHTGSGEKTQTCKVNVNFKLEGGETYKIYLKGDEDSVNHTHVRLTKYWPSDVTTLCK